MRLEILGYVSNMYIKYSTIKEILNLQNTEVSPLHYRQLLKSHKLFPNKPGEHDLDFFLIFFFLQYENLQEEADKQKYHLQIPDMLRETLGTVSSSYCATQIN